MEVDNVVIDGKSSFCCNDSFDNISHRLVSPLLRLYIHTDELM